MVFTQPSLRGACAKLGELHRDYCASRETISDKIFSSGKYPREKALTIAPRNLLMTLGLISRAVLTGH